MKKILKSGWLTHGKYTLRFEEEFSRFVNAKYSVTVSSCTAGLHLAYKSLGLKKNDYIITSSMTWNATTNAAMIGSYKTELEFVLSYEQEPREQCDIDSYERTIQQDVRGTVLFVHRGSVILEGKYDQMQFMRSNL